MLIPKEHPRNRQLFQVYTTPTNSRKISEALAEAESIKIILIHTSFIVLSRMVH